MKMLMFMIMMIWRNLLMNNQEKVKSMIEFIETKEREIQNK